MPQEDPIPNLITDDLSSEIKQCLSVAKIARSKKLDPVENIEIAFADTFSERLRNIVEISDVKEIKVNFPRASLDLVIKSLKEYVNKYTFYLDETSINKLLKLGLAILTEATNLKIVNFVSITLNTDEKNNKYLEVNFNELYNYLPSHEIFLVLILVEELRQIYNCTRPPLAKTIEYVDAIDRKIKSNTVSYSLDKNTVEAIKFVIKNLTFSISFKGTNGSTETSNLDAIDEIIKFIKKVFLSRIKYNVKIIKKLKNNTWLWIHELLHYKSEPHDIQSIFVCKDSYGGFTLRVGESQNTFHHYVGIHPSAFEILNGIVHVGDKATLIINSKKVGVCELVPVDTISPPLIKLNDGSTIRLDNSTKLRIAKARMSKILSFGDILVPVSFLPSDIRDNLVEKYNDKSWLKSSYEKLLKYENEKLSTNFLIDTLDNKTISLLTNDEITTVTTKLNLPIHFSVVPHLYNITLNELQHLLREVSSTQFRTQHKLAKETEKTLDLLCVEYNVDNNGLVISERDSNILLWISEHVDVFGTKNEINNNLLEILMPFGIIPVTYVGLVLRQNRTDTEKTHLHGIVPGLSIRPYQEHSDIIAFCKNSKDINSVLRHCPKCTKQYPFNKCPICGSETIPFYYCEKCNNTSDSIYCNVCGAETRSIGRNKFEWNEILNKSITNVHIQPYAPLNGINSKKEFLFVERLEKAIIRQKHDVKIDSDGIAKFYTRCIPLKYFKPKQILVTKEKLRELGYQHDILGKKLENDDQILRVKTHDIVIPYRIADQLRRVADFIDELLTTFYEMDPFYNIQTINDLIGHLIIGITKESNYGLVGRIIGFTDMEVCFCNPSWISTVRSNYENNNTAIILLLDGLINFSQLLVSDQIKSHASPYFIGLQTKKLPYGTDPEQENVTITGDQKAFMSEYLHAVQDENFLLWSERLNCIQSSKDRRETNILNLLQDQ
ncbi:MAG: hypothetical protein QXE12_04045, partial [Conexivisphaerales archaeon]